MCIIIFYKLGYWIKKSVPVNAHLLQQCSSGVTWCLRVFSSHRGHVLLTLWGNSTVEIKVSQKVFLRCDPACCPPTLTWSMPSVHQATTTKLWAQITSPLQVKCKTRSLERCFRLLWVAVSGPSEDAGYSYKSVCSKYNSQWREWPCCHFQGDLTLDCVEGHQTQRSLPSVLK